MSEAAIPEQSAYSRLMNKAFAEAKPMNCQIEITYRCNHLCTFCYNSPSGAREMTTEQIFEVVDKVSQLGVLFSVGFLGHFDPAVSLQPVIIIVFLVAFFGASQDIVIDAYRRELLADDEFGTGFLGLVHQRNHPRHHRLAGLGFLNRPQLGGGYVHHSHLAVPSLWVNRDRGYAQANPTLVTCWP